MVSKVVSACSILCKKNVFILWAQQIMGPTEYGSEETSKHISLLISWYVTCRIHYPSFNPCQHNWPFKKRASNKRHFCIGIKRPCGRNQASTSWEPPLLQKSLQPWLWMGNKANVISVLQIGHWDTRQCPFCQTSLPSKIGLRKPNLLISFTVMIVWPHVTGNTFLSCKF